MLKRFTLISLLLLSALPASGVTVLLGNHHVSFDIVGATRYFEFADFEEWQFPIQDLNWGITGLDLNPLVDPNQLDLNLPADSPKQNRNRIRLSFQGNLDIGLRVRSAISPRWGVEGYFNYTPADLVINFNGSNLAAANFNRYSGATNPLDPEVYLNWIYGDFPTYHITRFGANMDYVWLRSNDNVFNFYVNAGAGIVSYFRTGDLIVPTDYNLPGEPELPVPTAPENVTWYLPNDSFPSVNLGTGGIFFLHRYFGLNWNLRASYTSFEFKRLNFDPENHWIFSASIGYSIRI
ncbi:MAG: hypothetical protein QF492_05090 [Candidatus Krumholzibacteria bacterium]|jgi:hypothetical protein|nr:hypothetical protein [Candidatus Krumholzibacteria bacterium]MDP6669268.1 hypothetical protein [Candidatus Krumholzibacteria bacterium]MDP6796350.1 hypothetical protein [Candidatus Krumholzibacteria bacterium]MDP7021150.1 hypothetical protein [Candidatus Krumholzibacteria bacterium]